MKRSERTRMKRSAAKRSAAVLFWNDAGVITCQGHSPPATSIKWTEEGWTQVPDECCGGDPADVCAFCVELDSDPDERVLEL